MTFDRDKLELEWTKQREDFDRFVEEANAISADLSYLLAKSNPPASQSSIALVRALCDSVGAISMLPLECISLVKMFAFGAEFYQCKKQVLRQCAREQYRNYSRLPGKIVLQHYAKVGERVRLSYSHDRHGVISSKDCDHGTEIAVTWDDGTTWGDASGGLKCGKKDCYSLVYDN
jgi:hypothetical protein